MSLACGAGVRTGGGEAARTWADMGATHRAQANVAPWQGRHIRPGVVVGSVGMDR